MAEFGVYRRSEVEHFVGWARETIVHLRELAAESASRAGAAERRAVSAEAEATTERGMRLALERTLADRDRDMQATLGKALLLAQETVEIATAQAAELIADARADADRARAETAAALAGLAAAAAADLEASASSAGVKTGTIWSTIDDDDPLLAPLRIARVGGG
jgi:hypothetical protein